MKAVRLAQPGQPLEMVELDPPEIGPRDVLVRVKAAGICHSDAHYRAGISPVRPLPMTLGHEVAGIVESAGNEVTRLKCGDRVCLHYMVTCGDCEYCNRGTEQFCSSGKMIGKYRDGGYAEFIGIPARSAFLLPEEISFEHGAAMMCSSATSLHALRKARTQSGETVAVFGAGGLGMSAIQLAYACGAAKVFAIDIRREKLQLAAEFGATPIDAGAVDPAAEIRRLTGGRGVDVALELIGVPEAMRQGLQSLSVLGRLAIAGLTQGRFEIAPYQELLNGETEVIGVSDHLASEIPLLIDFVRKKRLDLSRIVTRTVPLDAVAINRVLDELNRFGGAVRSVITP
jgi:D-arabinose 1-dehydrogenase-like Zn-dependent alcohol dehydrogenase